MSLGPFVAVALGLAYVRWIRNRRQGEPEQPSDSRYMDLGVSNPTHNWCLASSDDSYRLRHPELSQSNDMRICCNINRMHLGQAEYHSGLRTF